MTPLTVVCWRWKPQAGYRSTFGPETVNVLRSMVARHYRKPHVFKCVTDDPFGIDSDIEIIPDWKDFDNLSSPHGVKNPSCYRRLRAFAPDIADALGPRFVSLDLDCVLTGDVSPLWDRPEEFVIYGDTNIRTFYNGSMFLLRSGARSKVWETFDPISSPKVAKAAGHHGSDQSWISYCLGPGEKKWTRLDGVYSYRNEIARNGNVLPKDARAVICHGAHDPWDAPLKTFRWVQEAYC